ncbi:DnaD domain protein [Neobacillus sp. OS1-2]|uniref:DnaD domain-containing protein n=1 Tax=Neobacillus sp. OS1-2 TaxID=3070680 RepID=UPI0027E0C87C|nr:DnaD domain protein [Neobacillus sp. OS1-2]WML38675.1 DnaD domain protein [Neobacillus sp. OS1-2]
MAKFRMIHTEFWNDPKVVEEMTPEDKFFFFYLLTNPNTTQIGIYQITKKQMAFDTGYSIESINALLDRFINHHKLVQYNPETRELAIKNWGKYNFNKGGKPVLDCVTSELKMVKDLSLISFVGERVEKQEIKKIYDTSTIRPRIDEKKENNESQNSQNALNQPFDDTSTIRGQEEEKEEEKEKEEEEEVTEDAAVFYQQNFGVLSPYIAENISYWEFDLSPAIVIESMKRTLSQNKRSWAYTESILKSWASLNLKTLESVLAFEHERAQKIALKEKQQAAGRAIPDEFEFDLSAGEG